jgi:hypothetical protein
MKDFDSTRAAVKPAIYLGDGAYVRISNGELRISCERDGKEHYVYLMPQELYRLILESAKAGLADVITAALKAASHASAVRHRAD